MEKNITLKKIASFLRIILVDYNHNTMIMI